MSQYLLEADKIYESTFVLGVSTDTGDAEGTETARADRLRARLAGTRL